MTDALERAAEWHEAVREYLEAATCVGKGGPVYQVPVAIADAALAAVCEENEEWKKCAECEHEASRFRNLRAEKAEAENERLQEDRDYFERRLVETQAEVERLQGKYAVADKMRVGLATRLDDAIGLPLGTSWGRALDAAKVDLARRAEGKTAT